MGCPPTTRWRCRSAPVRQERCGQRGERSVQERRSRGTGVGAEIARGRVRSRATLCMSAAVMPVAYSMACEAPCHNRTARAARGIAAPRAQAPLVSMPAKSRARCPTRAPALAQRSPRGTAGKWQAARLRELLREPPRVLVQAIAGAHWRR